MANPSKDGLGGLGLQRRHFHFEHHVGKVGGERFETELAGRGEVHHRVGQVVEALRHGIRHHRCLIQAVVAHLR